jgi:hypothetical protein
LAFLVGSWKGSAKDQFGEKGVIEGAVVFSARHVTMEPLLKSFEGTRWRSFIRKLSDTKMAMGLEVAKEGEEFKKYGESILSKTE